MKKKIEIISNIFSDHYVVRLDINSRGKKENYKKYIWRLNNMLLNSQQIMEEIKKEIKICMHQFSSVAQSCTMLCDPRHCSMPGLPVHHQLPDFTQTHIHWVSDAIQPSHPLSSPSPPAPNPSQHHSLFQWVNSSHKVAKVLEFQR